MLFAKRAIYGIVLGVTPALMAGCASGQLNYNTLDLASTTDNLLTTQILHNFANFIDSEAALPAQLTIASGTATTTNTITPSVGVPFGQTIATTDTLAVTAAAALSSTATGQRVVTTNPATSNLSASNVAAQNWAYDTITDPYRMHRLSALYRYAVDWSDYGSIGNAKFVTNFPLVQKVVSRNMSVCISGLYKDPTGKYRSGSPVLTNTSKAFVGAPGSVHLETEDLYFCATQGVQSGNFGHTEGSESSSAQIPDERYVTGAGCVACLKRSGDRIVPKNLQINKAMSGQWLHWTDATGRHNSPARMHKPDDIPIGHSGHYEFFVAKEHPDAFVEFSIAILAASTLADQPLTGGGGGGAGATAGSAGASPKAAPLELTLPITGGT